MPVETLSHLDPLLALLAILVLVVVVALPLLTKPTRSTKRRRHWTPYPNSTWQNPSYTPPTIDRPKSHEAVQQLQIVMSAEFTARPILNQSEARVFSELCQVLARHKPDWRVMAQVSLGEVLRSKNAEAFRCINAKRVDMLLVDEKCRPRHAIEYQGGAHYQGAAAARDAVKKEALRRAGIGYHEVIAGQTTPTELRQFLENLVSKADAR